MTGVLAIVHADSHVLGYSAAPDDRLRLQVNHAIMECLGIDGFTLAELDETDAAAAFDAGQQCTACTVVFPCGCVGEQLETCPHGTWERIALIGAELQPGPAATCRHCGQAIENRAGVWHGPGGIPACVKGGLPGSGRGFVPHEPMPAGLKGAPA